MSSQTFNLKPPSDRVLPCPRCGNRTHFIAHSCQFSEDCCDVWITCKCGYDPTAEHPLERMEDVWGSLDKNTITDALMCWSESIKARGTEGGNHVE